jgi:4-amino-4-deoxy-L-arabinose transferase-like glycosyltransferase
MLSKIRIAHVLLLAFLLRLLFFVIHQPWNPIIEETQVLQGDATGYHYLAQCILQHFSFCDNTFRTPGYPAFIAFFYFLFGIKPWVVLAAQIFLNVFSVWMLYRLTEIVFNKKIALIAAFLLAIDPHQILFCHFLFADTLFATLFLLSLFYFVKGLFSNKAMHFILCAVFLGLNLLTKPVIQFYPVALVLFLLIWTKFQFIERIKYAATIVIISALFVTPWMYRNYSEFGHFSVCSISGFNLFFYNVPLTETRISKIPLDTIINNNLRLLKSEHPDASSLPASTKEMWLNISFQNNNLYNDFAKDYLKKHKIAYLKAHANGMLKLMLNLGTQNFVEKLHMESKSKWNYEQRYTLSFFQQFLLFFKTKSIGEILLGTFILFLLVITYAGFLFGSWVMFRQRKILLWMLLTGSIVYFLLIYGVLPIVRFKLPITMLYLPISALGISGIIEYISSKIKHT